jgi:hypothetical protein
MNGKLPILAAAVALLGGAAAVRALTAGAAKHADLGKIAALATFRSELVVAEGRLSAFIERADQELKRTKDEPALHPIAGNYYRDKIGVWGNHAKTLPSNTYVNANVPVTPQLETFLRRTDHLEPLWAADLKASGPSLPWHYAYHLASNTLRILPWIDFPNLFGPETKWSMVRYFDSMEKVKEQGESTFCTRPFADAGGTGLTVTCCRHFVPSDDYADVILNCANFSFREALETLRTRLPKESECIEEIALKSSAKPIAYEPETIFNLRTGATTMGSGLIKQQPGGTYVPLLTMPIFSLEVMAYSTCD